MKLPNLSVIVIAEVIVFGLGFLAVDYQVALQWAMGAAGVLAAVIKLLQERDPEPKAQPLPGLSMAQRPQERNYVQRVLFG